MNTRLCLRKYEPVLYQILFCIDVVYKKVFYDGKQFGNSEIERHAVEVNWLVNWRKNCVYLGMNKDRH